MDTAYGKVSKQEYRRLCQEAEDAANDDNLEEYYGLDFDAEKQECHIRFEAHCEVCGFEFIFKHTEKVDLK